MRFFSFIFVLIFSLNIAGQSPTVSKLFSDGTNHANAERFDEALKSYKTALFLSENEYLGADYRARLHYNIGVCYFRTDRFDLATDHFKSAILLKTDYPRAHYALGMAKLRQRNWKAASQAFLQVLRLDPKNGEAWFDLAFANIALNDAVTAEHAFVRSIEFGSVDAALSHNNIGVILALKGDLERAERQFELAVEMSAGRLFEAKRNLEFCRAKRSGKPDLLAGEFRFAVRSTAVMVG
jgi:Flp pilus assembly protein TadD